MAYTYPPAPATISGDNITISRFLKNPTLVARRLRTILEQRFIADFLLSGRYDATGGSVQYETGESIFTDDDPEGVAPGSPYPISKVGDGAASLAKTVNWGQDVLVTDASIARRRMSPVNRAMTKLANQSVKYVDSISLAAIASAVTASAGAGAAWSGATAKQILNDALQAKANVVALNQGFDPNVVVVDDINHAYAMAAFGDAGYFGRENNSENPLVTGMWPTVGGLLWVATPNIPTAGVAIVADSDQLGGMADEDLGGPGYVNVNGVGVQVKTIRDDDNDQWKLRARRVTVPVVNEPAAARKITGI